MTAWCVMTMTDTYCPTCHDWVDNQDSPSGRHHHQPLLYPKHGQDPKPGTNPAKILQVMTEHQGWWSTWDLVPHTGSVHVRDFIRELKHLGWTFDERQDQTPDGKRYKSWKLILPKQEQGGLF